MMALSNQFNVISKLATAGASIKPDRRFQEQAGKCDTESPTAKVCIEDYRILYAAQYLKCSWGLSFSCVSRPVIHSKSKNLQY